jgi:hypothetical protein
VLSVLPHSSHNSKGLTVREYVMSCQDVSEMGDRPHALGRCPNTSDGRIAQRLTYLGKHRAFRRASICRLQGVDGCVPQMNRSRVITGHEQMDEEGFQQISLVQLVSAIAEAPRRQCYRADRASSSALRCFVGQTTCRNGSGGDSRSTCRRKRVPFTPSRWGYLATFVVKTDQPAVSTAGPLDRGRFIVLRCAAGQFSSDRPPPMVEADRSGAQPRAGFTRNNGERCYRRLGDEQPILGRD